MEKIDMPQKANTQKDKDHHSHANTHILRPALRWVHRMTRIGSSRSVSSGEQSTCSTPTQAGPNLVNVGRRDDYVCMMAKEIKGSESTERAHALGHPLSYVQTGDEPRMGSTL